MKEVDANQDRIFFISSEIGNRERSILELQNKMRKVQKKKIQSQGLLSQFIERKDKLEQAVNKPEKENISKICKIIKEMEKSLHEQDEMLASYSKQEARMWKDLCNSAEEKLSLLNKDNEYQLEYISISNKIDEHLSRELENLKKSYEEVSGKYQTEKSEIETRIQKASENAKNDLDLNLQNLQKSLNEKNKQIEQIYQELKILPLEIQNKEQQEENQRRDLQEQLTSLIPQSSHFSNEIATISQALEDHQKELEESRVNFAEASQKKMDLEKQVEHTKRKLEELHKQLEDAKTQLQQKSKEHNDMSECLIKAVEEQKQPQDRLVKAQEERQTLEEKYNKDLEDIKRKDEDLNNSISTQYKSILDLHTMKISPLEEELAKADHELTQARQELEHAKAEQHIAWRRWVPCGNSKNLRLRCNIFRLNCKMLDRTANAQTELQNAMREACEEIILQFTSNDEVRARLGEAKVEAMASREYRPNYGRAIEKHRDLASQYGLAMKEYEKRLEEEEKNLSNLNKVILNLRKKSEENSKFAKMVGCALKMMEREIDIYKEKNRIINNDHNRSEKDYEASNQAKELQKIQLESTKQELEEARNQLEDASIQLQEKLKERNNFSSLLTKRLKKESSKRYS